MFYSYYAHYEVDTIPGLFWCKMGLIPANHKTMEQQMISTVLPVIDVSMINKKLWTTWSKQVRMSKWL